METWCYNTTSPHLCPDAVRFYAKAKAEEIFGVAEGESFGGWLFPTRVEELDCLTMGDDVKESQEFSMDAAGCRQDCRKECLVSIR